MPFLAPLLRVLRTELSTAVERKTSLLFSLFPFLRNQKLDGMGTKPYMRYDRDLQVHARRKTFHGIFHLLQVSIKTIMLIFYFLKNFFYDNPKISYIYRGCTCELRNSGEVQNGVQNKWVVDV